MDVTRRIDVTIGELRLVGVDDARPEVLRTALTEELVRLLVSDPALRDLATDVRIEHHAGHLPAAGSATALGRAAAHTVAARLAEGAGEAADAAGGAE